MNKDIYFVKFLSNYKNFKSNQIIEVNEEQMWDYVFDSKSENFKICIYKSLGIMDVESIL